MDIITQKYLIDQILNLPEEKLKLLTEYLQKLVSGEINTNQGERSENYDFFASAGLWKDRQIDVQTLRKQVWRKVN